MEIKLNINRALSRLGLAIVREKTLAELLRLARDHEARQHSAEAAEGDGFLAAATEAQQSAVGAAEQIAEPTVATATQPGSMPQANFRLQAARNAPPRMCTALAPRFDASTAQSRLDRHIVEFQNKGITVIGTDAERAIRWREAAVFDRDVGNRHSAWDWAGNSISPYSDDLRAGIPSAELCDELRELFSAADFEIFFRGVLGCPATVANCRLVQSLIHKGSGIGPQSWHEDGCPPGVIRGVLYLTDVDQETGPFQYKDDAGNEQTVLGKTGDLLVFDAMRLRHRAMPPQSSVRTAIDLVFMPRLPGEQLNVVAAGMNHWPADPFFYSVPSDRTTIRTSLG